MQQFLFCRIPRSFDPPNMSKCQRVPSKGANGGLCRGSPAPGVGPGGSAMGWPTPVLAGLGYGRAPLAELPCWGARGLGQVSSIDLFVAHPLVFGAFLEAPKSDRRNS